MPETVLKPGDYDPNRGGYRPRLGFNHNNDYRHNKNSGPANRMIQ